MSGRTVTRYLAFDGDFFVHNGSWDEALQAAGWYPRRKGMASILDRYRNRPDPDASTSPAALLATNLPSTGYEDTDRIDLTIGWAERPEPPVAFGDLERGFHPATPCGPSTVRCSPSRSSRSRGRRSPRTVASRSCECARSTTTPGCARRARHRANRHTGPASPAAPIAPAANLGLSLRAVHVVDQYRRVRPGPGHGAAAAGRP
jgi:hypothetical protein